MKVPSGTGAPDRHPHPIEHEIDGRIIGPTLAQIRDIPRVIGVAGGPHKHEVIRAALRGSLVDVLVTDQANAERLLGGPQ